MAVFGILFDVRVQASFMGGSTSILVPCPLTSIPAVNPCSRNSVPLCRIPAAGVKERNCVGVYLQLRVERGRDNSSYYNKEKV